jgi:hypothetical protein
VDAAVLWITAAVGEPCTDIGFPVADVSADFEGLRTTPEMPPIAQGAGRYAEVGGGFLDGEHVFVGSAVHGSWAVCGGGEVVVVDGHGGLLSVRWCPYRWMVVGMVGLF